MNTTQTDTISSHIPTFFRNINSVPSLTKTAKGLLIHFIVTFVFSITFYILFKDLTLVLVSFVFGFFLDADHLVDYFLYLQKFKRPFSLKEFLSGSYFAEWKRFITPLHNYELACILLVVYFLTRNPLYLVTGISLFQHYIIDYFVNYVRPAAYSFIFRAKNNFVKSKIRA